MKTLNSPIKISPALSELLDFSEIYCSASCCGLQAFEIHKSLLLRKIIDKNIESGNGLNWYNITIILTQIDLDSVKENLIEKVSSETGLKVEIDSLHLFLSNLVIDNEEEIPVFYPKNGKLPEYCLPKNELQHLMLRWQRVLKQVKGTQAVP